MRACPPLAYAIMDRSTDFARHVLAAEGAMLPDESSDPAAEPRTLDQIRADVVADLLLTATPSGHRDAEGAPLAHIRGEIHVTIPVATAAGVDDEPALLAGYGPIDAELARRLMAASPAWNRVLVDLPTGLPVAVDRYRPSADLKRFCRDNGLAAYPRLVDVHRTLPFIIDLPGRQPVLR